MLVLSRKPGERVIIGNHFTVSLIFASRYVARLVLESPVGFHALMAEEYEWVFKRPFIYTGAPQRPDESLLSRCRNRASFEMYQDESIVLPFYGWQIVVVSLRYGQVRLGFEVPKVISVHREEVWEAILNEGANQDEHPQP